MEKTYPTALAYPLSYEEEVGDYGRRDTCTHKGLSKREYFAAVAMQGLCTPCEGDGPSKSWDYGMIAECAVKAADALIKELNKEVQP